MLAKGAARAIEASCADPRSACSPSSVTTDLAPLAIRLPSFGMVSSAAAAKSGQPTLAYGPLWVLDALFGAKARGIASAWRQQDMLLKVMDVFWIALPSPSSANVDIRPVAASAFGTVEEQRWYWHDNPIGKATGPMDLRPWSDWLTKKGLPESVLVASATWHWLHVDYSVAAAWRSGIESENHSAVGLPLMIHGLLESQSSWLIWVERDADQHPVEVGAMTPTEVAAHLREVLLGASDAIDFIAWPRRA